MFLVLLGTVSFSVLASGLRYNSHDYRKEIVSESAEFPRIIGGGDASIEKYPFAVSLQNNGTFYGHEVEHFCGGSIIGKKWIITSAQCALRIQIQDYHVMAGSEYYYKNGVTYEVESIAVHPMFNEINYDYDVGLVKLSKSITFDNKKQPIRLPKTHVKIQDGVLVHTVGWGATRILGPVSDELHYGIVSKISTEYCNYANGGDVITQQMFCLLSDVTKPCIGDSGSPAILSDTILGVASWSRGCSFSYPTAYTDISEVTNWITEITGIS